MHESLQLLVQLTTILLVVRVVGWACRKLGQPQVVGELAAGLLLGPSLLGNIALACAAVDDVTAWSALALLVMAVRADNSEPDAGQMLLGAFGLVAALILVRPLLAHLLRLGRSEYLSHDGLALALLLA